MTASANPLPSAELTDAGRSGLYERDLYAWTLNQAAALRAGRFRALDVEHLAEEIESSGREQLAKLRSALRLIVMHMLNWDYQPERRTRSWTVSIANQRSEAEYILGENPSLRSRLNDVLNAVYARSKRDAADETGLKFRVFPDQCPYTLDVVLLRAFEWPEE